MKKIFFLIICFILFSPLTNAFLGEDLWLNLYKDINEWINKLEEKQYEYELKWQWESIKDNFNRILNSSWYWNCIKNELTIEEINEISSWNIEVLSRNISWECLTENGNISNASINNILQIIKYINQTTKEKAEQKTIQLNNISKIWIYSDWNEENSPFDLVTDLQNIDYYIFTQKIPYNWELLENNDELINWILWINDKNNIKWNFLNSLKTLNLANYNNNQNNNSNNKWENDSNQNTIIENNYKCIDDSVNSELSWLNQDEITKLINNSDDINVDQSWINNDNNISSSNNNGNSNIIKNSNNDNWGYKKLNDNWVFPCTTFFCITIEFLTYQHNLLWWWETVSIEYLINRSNEHLKKFASTSLIQAKMTSNNFEFWLKDLNLPDIFHVWFIITKKPVPILDIKLDETKNTKTENSKDNLLESYYNNYWLEYKRKNDMKIFEWSNNKSKIILDLASLNTWKLEYKMTDLNNINQSNLNKNNFISKAIFQQIATEELNDFEKRFIELNTFTNSINTYIENIKNIINFMNKIKIDKW